MRRLPASSRLISFRPFRGQRAVSKIEEVLNKGRPCSELGVPVRRGGLVSGRGRGMRIGGVTLAQAPPRPTPPLLLMLHAEQGELLRSSSRECAGRRRLRIARDGLQDA